MYSPCFLASVFHFCFWLTVLNWKSRTCFSRTQRRTLRKVWCYTGIPNTECSCRQANKGFHRLQTTSEPSSLVDIPQQMSDEEKDLSCGKTGSLRVGLPPECCFQVLCKIQFSTSPVQVPPCVFNLNQTIFKINSIVHQGWGWKIPMSQGRVIEIQNGSLLLI